MNLYLKIYTIGVPNYLGVLFHYFIFKALNALKLSKILLSQCYVFIIITHVHTCSSDYSTFII